MCICEATYITIFIVIIRGTRVDAQCVVGIRGVAITACLSSWLAGNGIGIEWLPLPILTALHCASPTPSWLPIGN